MTPNQLAEALMVRRRREDKALRALNDALSVLRQAQGMRDQAQSALDTFDRNLEARMSAFFERSKIGFNPDAVMGMRGFHADQMHLREGYFPAIEMANSAVSMAEDAVADARQKWRLASQAAENLQDMHKKASRELMRHNERRQEQDRDEISAMRAVRNALE